MTDLKLKAKGTRKFGLGKYFFLMLTALVTIAVYTSCSDDDSDPPVTPLPSNLEVAVNISGKSDATPNGDGTGEVTFTASADNATSYRIRFEGAEVSMPNGTYNVTFELPGVNSYEVEVVALNSENKSISEMVRVDVVRNYPMPNALKELLGKGQQDVAFRVKSEATGHMGIGPADATTPDWWAAGPGEKDFTSMYDDRYKFGEQANGNTLQISTEGYVYGKAIPLTRDFGASGVAPNAEEEIEFYPLNDFTEPLYYSEIDGVQRLHLDGNGFFGFYVGGDHVYEILDATENDLVLKTIGWDNNAWFIILTKEEEKPIPEDPEYTNLVWEDDFDTDGSPNAENWGYDIGRGSNGWGNGELQYYTDRLDNAKVEDGILKITAMKENYQGASYTSARMLTMDKFEFTYGKVEIRAKLAGGGGTWPALWMLGANFPTVGWPACGEVDIMEYVGNNPGKIQSALHNSESFGNTIHHKSTAVENETEIFHVYTMIWSEDQISFYLDGERYYTYRPASKNVQNWPYDKDHFLIMNVAMGGTLGGNIDSGFSSSTMEIDYVRVYQ